MLNILSMKLKDHLKTNKIKKKTFAHNIGIHHVYLSQILGGYRNPSPKLALRIQQATGGQVTINELLYPSQTLHPTQGGELAEVQP